MLHRSWGRAIAAAAILCAPLFGGDYDRLFDTVKELWPDRSVAMALCDKDANQFALIDLADTAKARNISLIIVDCREEKEYNRVMVNALARNPGFVLIIDEDPLLGAKGRLTSRMVYRLQGRSVPAVGISKHCIEQGAVLAVGAGAGDPIFASKELATRMSLPLPAKFTDPLAKK